MLTPIGNRHRSSLPRPGALVIIKDRPLGPGRRYRRFIVEAYPLCDGALWQRRHFSLGIHTVFIRALDNGWRTRVAGHYCEEID